MQPLAAGVRELQRPARTEEIAAIRVDRVADRLLRCEDHRPHLGWRDFPEVRTTWTEPVRKDGRVLLLRDRARVGERRPRAHSELVVERVGANDLRRRERTVETFPI